MRTKVHRRSAHPAGPFPIIGVGASAGGLEAFLRLLKALPAVPRMALVFVTHLAPGRKSHLDSILSAGSKLLVVEAKNGMEVKSGHVYLIPPGKDMEIEAGRLRLRKNRRGSTGFSPVIDRFLQSLALDRKDQAIGIVLSGEASDGTLGLQAVKAEGGITFAQDDSATHSSMPRSAAASGAVDFVLPPEEIAQELLRICEHPYLRSRKDGLPEAKETDDDALKRICVMLRGATGVDFANYKQSTIKRRIFRRMALKRIVKLDKYLAELKKDAAELATLYDDILIHVTSFFREPEAFKFLKSKVYPRLLRDRRPQEPVRIWVPGCSTGEEAYSHAINLLEHLGDRAVNVPIQIFATDISEKSLETARAGIYPKRAALDVSPDRLRRFFTKRESGYQILKSIRDLCVFARQNVTRDPPFSNLDIISCRNVLIYLGPALQRKVIPVFHYALKPHGYLMLGSAETIGHFSDKFSLADKRGKIYAKKPDVSGKGGGIAPRAYAPGSDFVTEPPKAGKGGEKTGIPAPSFDLQKEIDRLLLSEYTPAAVLVNEDMDILQFRRRTSPFLEPAPGKASLNLLKMVRENLLIDLRAVLHKAKRDGVTVRKEGIPLKVGAHPVDVAVEVVPIKGWQAFGEKVYLVLFQQSEHPAEGSESAQRRRKSDTREIAKLQQELGATREYLRSVTEEHESTNEELKSANEEIVSSNEELQSMNEELETAKEELQSTNEELTTVNEELNQRNFELNSTNNDLSNLLLSAHIPVVMLGNDMRIRRFTPMAEKILNLIPGDIGRPLSDIKPSIEVPDLDKLVAETIDSVSVQEREVKDRNGRWYAMWVRPYKTADNKIDGAVVSFMDIHEQKSALVELKDARDYAETIVDAVQDGLVVLDERLRVLSANRSFYEALGLSPGAVEGQYFPQLERGNWNVPRLKPLLEGVLRRGVPFSDFKVERATLAGVTRLLRLGARPLGREPGGQRKVLVTIEDVTARHQAEEAESLRKREAMQREFVANVSHELRTPIAAIKGFSETLLKGGLEDTRKRAEFVQVIDRHANRLSHLVEDLLEISSLEAGRKDLKTRAVRLKVILGKAVRAIKPASRKKRVRVAVKVDPKLRVAVDPAQLMQVLQNLLENAVKYNYPQGTVAVHSRVAGKEAVVSIQGTGIGIPKKDLPFVFDRFHRSHNAKARAPGSSGLGLAIVKTILQSHGCRIWVESVEKKGATFYFTLPLA